MINAKVTLRPVVLRPVVLGLCFLGVCLAQAVGAQTSTPAAPVQKPSASSPGAVAVPAIASPDAAVATALVTERDRMSYAVGVAYARGLKAQGLGDVNVEMIVRGMRDVTANQPLLMAEDDYRATYSTFQQGMIQKMGKARDLAAFDNKKAGDDFLAENAKKEGVISLDSGMQYKILTQGKGAIPTEESKVTAHYRGTLLDGVEIDSTYRRGQPATFMLKGSIAGWREAIKLMPVGSKWQLFIPASLAYSKQGAGRNIGPNAFLIFEVELISIDKI
jgi:FKBP-type peptidyl-prolyl cis-trans isomerase